MLTASAIVNVVYAEVKKEAEGKAAGRRTSRRLPGLRASQAAFRTRGGACSV